MFQTVKQTVDLLALISEYAKQDLVSCGTDTYAMEDKTCPFCGHKDCFRVKYDESDKLGAFYKCFSCSSDGDAIGFIEKVEKLKPVDAARFLAKKYDIKLPNNRSPIQEIFEAAALYYAGVFQETTKTYPELEGNTPVAYQVSVRGHTRKVLDSMKVGWSDGGLCAHLASLGFDVDLIAESGLQGKKGRDFLPAKVFIYPHMVRGKVSHFTFKDPLKKLAYQLPNKDKLNGHAFFNQDSATKGPVLVVEGENDLLSVLDAEWEGGAIATIGNISTTQFEWLGINLANMDVVSIFDSDAAGDEYRVKMARLGVKFKSLVQVKLSGVKDIDEYLKAGGDIHGAIKSGELWKPGTSVSKKTSQTSSSGGSGESSESEEESGEIQESAVFEKDGCYWKYRYVKEGDPIPIQLTDFTMVVNQTYITAGKRDREVVFIRKDGRKSDPTLVTSEDKVSLRSFRVLCANAIDASYRGKEEDLSLIWDYLKEKYGEREVEIPMYVGRLEPKDTSMKVKGWLFKECFITDDGMIYEADEKGIIWIGGSSRGIRPISLEVSTMSGHASTTNIGTNNGIPNLRRDISPEDTEKLLEGFVFNLSKNLNIHGKQLPMVMTMIGYMWAVAYSNQIVEHFKSFPLMFAWGQNGQGKSTVLRWLLYLYDMAESGHSTVAQFNSGVGWGRKMNYYSSLPMFLDELRADQEGREMNKVLRNFYDRTPRNIASKDSFGVRVQEIRSTTIVGGQDKSIDAATKERCMHIYVSSNEREKVESFQWFKDNIDQLSAIGHYFVSNHRKLKVPEILSGIDDLRRRMQNEGITSRTALCFATGGYFANILRDMFYPGMDFSNELVEMAKSVTTEQRDDSMVVEFFETVHSLQIKENSPFGSNHIRVEGEKLYVHLKGVFNEVNNYRRGANSGEPFSRTAIRNAILEESFCDNSSHKDGEIVRDMGQIQRVRIIQIDLTKAPSVFDNIASYSLMS